jgi:alpha-tubulin suppressor-like RCC1 family protein
MKIEWKRLLTGMIAAVLCLGAGSSAQAQTAAAKRLPIVAGNGFIYVLMETDGTVKAWGSANDPPLDPAAKKALPPTVGTPQAVAGVRNVVSASVGDPAKPKTDASNLYHLTPCAVPGVAGVRAIQAGLGFVMVQLKDGTLRGWGEGYYGGLENGSSDGIFPLPQTPKGVGPVQAYYVAGRRVVAIRTDGKILGWGPLNMTTLAGEKRNATLPVELFKSRAE